MSPFVATLALVGVVIMVAALLSGLVDRVRLPQVALFLALGAALGPAGLGLVDFALASPVLQSIATLALVLVLFTDAVSVDLRAVRANARLAFLVLGPGTLLTVVLVAVAAWGLLDLPPALAAVLGAALASTDPVMVRGLLRGPDLPDDARLALRLESGLNDLVLLPIVLVVMAIQDGQASGAATAWGQIGLRMLVLGPGAGVAVGFAAVALLEGMRHRVGIRRDYESIYVLGVAFAAFAAAEAVHGSGFLAAFAAGLTVAAFDAELCDCFLDYGEATAEMFLLLTFVAFGTSLIWTGLRGLEWRSFGFAAVALGARSLVLLPALAGAGLTPRSRRLITWYGPRGLASLLLVLLPIFAGLPDAERLFPITALVVLWSVVVHGGALMVTRSGARPNRASPATPAEPQPSDREPAVASRDRITLDEMKALLGRGERVVLLDVRKERAWDGGELQAQGAIRLPPDNARTRAAELALPRHDWLVAYCA
jgi:NhaP-type Na+/H+ or K+/H+ antiporter